MQTQFTPFEQRALANIEAIELLADTTGSLSESELAVLTNYNGWGGLAALFDTSKPYSHLSDRLKDSVGDETFKSLRQSILSSYFTPELLSAVMWSLLAKLGFTGGAIFEPAAGDGALIEATPANIRAESRFVAVESCPVSASVLQAKEPNVKVINTPFQSIALPYDYYDAGILNPPFLETFIQDDFDRKVKGSEHNFFLLKSIRLLREGGLLCALVTRSFLDAADPTSRIEIAKFATLKAAYRLPNTMFARDNTNVITDIVIFQRTRHGETNREWVETGIYQETPEGNATINGYFLSHPDHIIGQPVVTTDRFKKLMVDIQPVADLDIANAIDSLADELVPCFVDMRPATLDHGDSDVTVSSVIKLFNLGLDDNGQPVKRIMDFEGTPQYEKMSFNATQIKRLSRLLNIRELLLQLLGAEATDPDNDRCDRLRAELNQQYDSFVAKFGAINGRGNLFMRECSSFGALQGLEANYDEGISERKALKEHIEPVAASWNKAPIFHQRLNSPINEAPKVESPTDALIASLKFKGMVDLSYMSDISGISNDALIDELTGAIFFNPVSEQWEYKDVYLSGNVLEKLRQAEEKLPFDPRMQGNINALTDVLPEMLSAGHISVAFGAPWVPGETLKDFIDHLLVLKPNYKDQAQTAYVGGRWFSNITAQMVDYTKNRTVYGTSRVDAIDTIHKLLNFSPLRVTDTEGSKRVLNVDETQRLQNNAEQIKEEWSNWIFADEARKTTITELYNQRFNCWREPTYDGSLLVDEDGYLPQQSHINKPREHQLSCVMRSVLSQSLLVDASVGAGKTLIALSSLLMQKRLGLIKKAMIVVPNHLINNWISEIAKFYPSVMSKTLVGTEYLTSKKQREGFLASIALGDWDLILIARSTFGLIPCTEDYSTDFIQGYIDEVDQQMALVDCDFTLRELEKVKHGLNNKLLSVMNRQSRDKTNFPFESLGVGTICVDEIHEGGFKNLFYLSKMNNVGGMGQADGSQAALDLFMKARYLQNKQNGRGLMALSGTTITNSIVEAYTYLRYFYFDEAVAAGLTDLDTFVSIFATPSTEYELSVTGAYKERTRLRSFTNLPELSELFRQFTFVITKSQMKARGKELGIPWFEPEIAGGKPQMIICPRSPEQAAYMKQILWRAENLSNVTPEEDNLLKITSDAAKAALDMRLIAPSSPASEDGKIGIASRIIAKDYALSHGVKGVILAYIDLGVPGGASGLNLYAELKAKLVELGVLESHVVFAHDANTLARKRVMEDQLNAGEKRVFIASTVKGASGLNIQKRVVSIHNIDQSLSWTPAAIEQRLGRGLRSGSELLAMTRANGEADHTIRVYNYATDQSLDSFRFSLLETKARFIQSLKDAQTHQRIITEDDAGEESADSFAAIKAAISGNPLILAAVKTDKTIKQLELKRRAFQSDLLTAQAFVSRHAQWKSEYADTLQLVALDIETAKNNPEQVFTCPAGKLSATSTPATVLEERYLLAQEQQKVRLAEIKDEYKTVEAEQKALIQAGHARKSPVVAKLDTTLAKLQDSYRLEKARRVRKPRCDLAMLFEREMHMAKQHSGTNLYGSTVEFGCYRGFRISLSADFRKKYVHINGAYFAARIAVDDAKAVRPETLINKMDEALENVKTLQSRVDGKYDNIANTFAVYEQRQHDNFEHEDELQDLYELQAAIQSALVTKTDLDPKFAHLLPSNTFEPVPVTLLSDIDLPERISPPECYLSEPDTLIANHETKACALPQNIFDATASLAEFFGESLLDEALIEEHDLIF